jgi:hypothetical protein
MSPHDAERMTTRYQLLFVAVERAINEADPIGLLELSAPSGEGGKSLELKLLSPEVARHQPFRKTRS